MIELLDLPSPDLFHARRRANGEIAVHGASARLIGRQVAHQRQGDKPDGVWAQWLWRDGTLTATNDRHGYLPLYYVADAEEVCVSPSLVDVVRQTGRRSWDPLALGVFVRIGTFLGDETPFRDVRVLPPNGVLRWRPGGATLVADRRPGRAATLTRDAAMDGFIDLVRAAVRRRLPATGEQAWMPISGGRDSRHLLFELRLAGARPLCLTTRYRPPATTQDAEVAAAVCRAADCSVEVLDAPRDWFACELRKNRLIGFSSTTHAWFLPMAEHMAARGGVAYDGIGGDVLSAGHFIEPKLMQDYEAGRYEAIARSWFDPGHERFLRRLLSAEARAAMPREAAVVRTAVELKTYAGDPIPINAYAMAVRARRSVVVTQYGFLRRLNAVLSPYLDAEVFDFLMGLPWQLFADKAFHTDAIARAFPEHAHLAYAVKGATTPHGAPAEFRRFASQFLGYLLCGRPPRTLSLAFLGAAVAHSLLMGSNLTPLPVLLLQLEREVGLEVG